MDTFEKYQHAGMTVEIGYDPDPEHSNPRDFDGNVGVMLCSHRRYRLGDEQVSGDDFTTSVTCPTCEGTGEDQRRCTLLRKQSYGWESVGAGSIESMHGEMSRIIAREARKITARDRDPASTLMVEVCDCTRCEGTGEIELSIAGYLRQERGATVILPLGLIDHSGISMYVGAGAHRYDPGGWDSGQVGVIFDTTETRKDCGMEDAGPEGTEKALRDEVDIYAEYLRGEVYFFAVNDPDGEHVDSCFGFLGDLDYVRSQANEAAEHAAQVASDERAERHAMACRGVETV